MNTITKLTRRTVAELQGLSYAVLMDSARTIDLVGTFKLVRPNKTYKNIKLRFYPKYTIKIKQ